MISGKPSIRPQGPDQETGEIVRQRLTAMPAVPGAFLRRLVQCARNGLPDNGGIIGTAGSTTCNGIANDLTPLLTPTRHQGRIGTTTRIDHRSVRHGGTQNTRMRIAIIVNRMQRGGDHLLQVLARAARIAQMNIHFLARFFNESQKAGALIRIVKIESPVPEPGFARDILRARRVIAALDKELARGAFDLGKTLGLAPHPAVFGFGGVYSGAVHDATFGMCEPLSTRPGDGAAFGRTSKIDAAVQ